jgi:predicted  nucleic acid-binding Zn-ribbon protein
MPENGAYDYSDERGRLLDDIGRLSGERDEARAEVERLRERAERAEAYESAHTCENERLREALRRAHDALDVEHGHTAETWEDRQRERAR